MFAFGGFGIGAVGFDLEFGRLKFREGRANWTPTDGVAEEQGDCCAEYEFRNVFHILTDAGARRKSRCKSDVSQFVPCIGALIQ